VGVRVGKVVGLSVSLEYNGTTGLVQPRNISVDSSSR